MYTVITIAAILFANAIGIGILLIAIADDLRAPPSLPGAQREGGVATSPRCAARSCNGDVA